MAVDFGGVKSYATGVPCDALCDVILRRPGSSLKVNVIRLRFLQKKTMSINGIEKAVTKTNAVEVEIRSDRRFSSFSSFLAGS